MLIDFQHRINVDAEYQRGKVWSAPQQALLIDSILRNFDIPKIFLRRRSDGDKFLFDVIDGKQRLTAIWRFASGDFRLLRSPALFPDLGNLGGRDWSELPTRAQDKLQFSHITVSTIEDATKEEIHELFLRLQQGEPLNAAERRNAMLGPVQSFVTNTLAKHSLWGKTGIRSTRFGIAEHSAIVLALAIANGPAGLKGPDLQNLYESDDFDNDGLEARRATNILDRLDEIASKKINAIRTRWGLVDLSIVILTLEQEDRIISPSEIMRFFESFEEKRRAVGNLLSDFQTRLVNLSENTDDQSSSLPEAVRLELPNISSSMLTYYLSFAREGGTVENVRTRSKIMYQELLNYINKHAV